MPQHRLVADARRRRRTGTLRIVMATVLTLAVVVAAAVTAARAAGHRRPAPPARIAVRTHEPAAPVTVLSGSPAVASADLARLLLARAPDVVVANPAVTAAAADLTAADLTAAAATARRTHGPLLLSAAPGSHSDQTTLLSGIRSLRPAAVLAVGQPTHSLAAQLRGVRVTAIARGLPRTVPAAPLHHVVVLVNNDSSAISAALLLAVRTTSLAAGAEVVGLTGYDPRTDPAGIRALAAAKPTRVIAVGAGFGTPSLLGARLAVAETGVQLPGGGQVLFPGHEIVALYGTPRYPALGALGEQDLQASIARAKAVAAQYDGLTTAAVVPAFEIIATVASASPGPDGTYSTVTSPATLRPWVLAATSAGLYVTLDLQPGRANFLAQAKLYQSLLELPDVGLALDPEWKLQPGQLPLHQIGSVSIAEVNSVVTWLAALTAQHHLPQKLLELHEFRLSMISGIGQLDTSNDNLAIVVNMDGEGAPSAKLQTWQAVVANAPPGVFFGWKDFYVKDTPMLGPVRTIRHTPTPVVISYE